MHTYLFHGEFSLGIFWIGLASQPNSGTGGPGAELQRMELPERHSATGMYCEDSK